MKRIASCLALLLAGCTGSVTSQSVDRVRILAVRSDPANAAPGDTVKLTALAVSPIQNDPDITVTWYFCQYGNATDCAEKNDLQVLGTGPTISQTVPPTALPGDNFILWLDAVGHGERERALKAVPVRAASDPVNHNPLMDRTWWGGPQDPGGTLTVNAGDLIKIHLASSQVVNEIYLDSGIVSSEQVQVRTYTSGGTLVDKSGTGASGMLRYDTPLVNGVNTTGTFGAWIIVNDGRGGVDWIERWIQVVSPGGSS